MSKMPPKFVYPDLMYPAGDDARLRLLRRIGDFKRRHEITLPLQGVLYAMCAQVLRDPATP